MSQQANHIWNILATIPDPEIPAISITELGVIRQVEVKPLACPPSPAQVAVVVTVTPTYSGCPAYDMMRMQIRMALLQAGYKHIEIKQQLAPAWTTDWMTDAAKEKLRAYGIAPPLGLSKTLADLPLDQITVPCPRCGSTNTQLVSQFSATACKAFFTCSQCKEPFEHFKCH